MIDTIYLFSCWQDSILYTFSSIKYSRLANQDV
jgi:hypothetical protein